MILPFLDYCDIVWGDRNNKVLMDSFQVLQNRAAKIVLDRPVYSSSSQGLLDLKWKELRVRRRIHRLIYFFKCLNGPLDHNYHFTTNSSVRNYQTRHANDLRTNRSRCSLNFSRRLLSLYPRLSERRRQLKFRLVSVLQLKLKANYVRRTFYLKNGTRFL